MEKKASIFTRLFTRQKDNDGIESMEIPDLASIPTVARTLPQTILTFTKEQEERFPEEQRDEWRQLLATMPPLEIGKINFIPFETGTIYGGYYVRLFIRNGRDVEADFELTQLPLSLIDAAGEKVAAGFFRIQNFGTLKFGETRVWTFAWRPEQVFKQDADLSGYTVDFE